MDGAGPPQYDSGTVACSGFGFLAVQDNGTPGTLGAGDHVAITLDGFHGVTYTNSGAVGGGGIAVHDSGS